MEDAQKPPTSKDGPDDPTPDSWEDLSSVVQHSDPPERVIRKRAHPSSVPPKHIRPSLPPEAQPSTRIRGVRLFIIDDDPIRVDALAMDLRNLGAIVAVGDRSQSGYTQAAKFLPDAIISDLVRPGQPGFQFIQNLRRHPLLRWGSVVLIRWWKEIAEDEGEVLLEPVLDQLEEVLAPIRIIEERISAGRPLGERLDMTGPGALLRLIAHAKLTGELSVNDAWNMFTIQLVQGRILSAYRKGIDGESDDDAQALFQFLLCDAGRWSLKLDTLTTKRETRDTEEALLRANKILSLLFGPQKKQDADLDRRLIVRRDFLRTASAILADSPMTIPEAIAGGADYRHFASLITNKKVSAEAERTVQTLFRSGAIRYRSSDEAEITGNQPQLAASVAELLRVLAEMPLSLTSAGDHPVSPTADTGVADRPSVEKGAYHIQDVEAENLRVEKKRVQMKLVAANGPSGAGKGEGRRPEDVEAGLDPVGETAVVAPGDSSLDRSRSPSGDRDSAGSGKIVAPSGQMAIGKYPGNVDLIPRKEASQMWVAIVLALMLGGLIFFGIYLIASAGKHPRSPGRTPAGDVSR